MLSIRNLLKATFVVICSALIHSGSASQSSVAVPPGKIEWLRVPDDLLSGIGIKDSLDFGKQVEHVGNQAATAELRKVVFAGQLRTSVVQGAADAIHLPSFPDDEFFCIVVGRLTLTADVDKIDQEFYAGDCVFVPKGWVGVWRQHAGVYREWATVPASYSFTESLKSNPPVRGARAFALEVPQATGTHRLHTGSLIVEAENAASDSARSITAQTDETIHILRGNLTLKSAGMSDIFKPGDIVILPKGLNAEMRVGAGYRAFIVRAK
jgi:uncharacterized cupin superfamily protein